MALSCGCWRDLAATRWRRISVLPRGGRFGKLLLELYYFFHHSPEIPCDCMMPH